MKRLYELSLFPFLIRGVAGWVGGFALFALIPLIGGTLLKGWSSVPQSMALFVQMAMFGIVVGAPLCGMQYRAIHALSVFSLASIRCSVLAGLLSTIGAFIGIIASRTLNSTIEPTLEAHVVDAVRYLPWFAALWSVPLLPLRYLPRARY